MKITNLMARCVLELIRIELSIGMISLSWYFFLSDYRYKHLEILGLKGIDTLLNS